MFFHLLLQFLLPQLSAQIPPPPWAFPKAPPPPKALYTPLFSLLPLHVRSTSETVLFSDNLFTSPDFFFQLLMPPCLEHCLAQSWCSIIDKKKGKRLVRGGVWTWEAGGTSQPVYLENPPLSALPGTLTRPSPPQSSFSSIQ